jgi:hypothetical protein
MAFTERHEHKIEIIPPYNILQCRRADIVEKDGKEVGRTYHRHVKTPGSDMTGECAEMQQSRNTWSLINPQNQVGISYRFL